MVWGKNIFDFFDQMISQLKVSKKCAITWQHFSRTADCTDLKNELVCVMIKQFSQLTLTPI